MLVKDLKKDSKENKDPEDLKKEAIRNFVLKNHQSEGDSEKIIEKKVEYFLQKTIGSNEKGQVGLIDEGKLLTITRKGDILGPS